jgi:monomeric sarcosine oxidase
MGAASACALSVTGARVALLDQARLPNPRAASFDHSKVFRFAYPDPFYVRLAVDSLKLWRELEEATGARLMTQTGLVLLAASDGSFEMDCYLALCEEGLEAEVLDRDHLARRYPQFNTSAIELAVYDPSGAILHATACVRAMLDLARQRGAEVVEGQRAIAIESPPSGGATVVTEGGARLRCRELLVAAGPWTRKLLPELNELLTTTHQETGYFQPNPKQAPAFEVGSFPIFIELTNGFYGFPIHNAGAMKIANHHKGVPADPYEYDERVGDGFEPACTRFFRDFIPGLSDARAKELRVCLYNNTPDDDFIIDRHPFLADVFIATGFSGHGFKFAPAIGRITTGLMMMGETSFEFERFGLSRFERSAAGS